MKVFTLYQFLSIYLANWVPAHQNHYHHWHNVKTFKDWISVTCWIQVPVKKPWLFTFYQWTYAHDVNVVKNYQSNPVPSKVCLRPVYTFRHRPRHRHSARQSLTLCQWLMARMGLEPILPVRLPITIGHCDGDRDGVGMCKQAFTRNVSVIHTIIECDLFVVIRIMDRMG